MLPSPMDQIEEGDYIAISQWVGLEDRSYIGDVLRVLAVSLPFAAVELAVDGRGHTACRRLSLCLRDVRWTKLTAEYVAAMGCKEAP